MASATVTKKLKEDAICTICRGLLTEPVTIDCGHNYCHLCLVDLIEKGRSSTSLLRIFHCPQCRKPFKGDDILRPNKQLKNIIDTIKETDQERLCEKHGERLDLFCEDDGQLICWRCERSPQHRGHVIALVEEACQGYREQLQKVVKKLEAIEINDAHLLVGTKDQINNWKEKINQEKEKIHSEFMNLYKFLQEEEKICMCSLEEEKERKLSRLEDNVARLENKLEGLRNRIVELGKKCQGSAHDLLQGIKDTLSKSSNIRMETPDDVSLEIQTVCNISDFKFSKIERLKRYQVKVTANSDTAHPRLQVFDNPRSVENCTDDNNFETSARRSDS